MSIYEKLSKSSKKRNQFRSSPRATKKIKRTKKKGNGDDEESSEEELMKKVKIELFYGTFTATINSEKYGDLDETNFSEFSGVGILEYDSGGKIYDGHFKNGLRDGFGDLVDSSEKIIYSGEWKNNMKEGSGTYNYQDGSIYHGEFKEDKKHGTGKIIYSNTKLKYNGEFLNDKMHGYGKYYRSNGKLHYDGEFFEGQRHNCGINYFTNNEKYDGNWKFNTKHGIGKYYYSSKHIYSGEWVHDQRYNTDFSQYSKIIFPNGDIFKCSFRNDIQHGEGKFYKKKKTKNNSKEENNSNLEDLEVSSELYESGIPGILRNDFIFYPSQKFLDSQTPKKNLLIERIKNHTKLLSPSPSNSPDTSPSKNNSFADNNNSPISSNINSPIQNRSGRSRTLSLPPKAFINFKFKKKVRFSESGNNSITPTKAKKKTEEEETTSKSPEKIEELEKKLEKIENSVNCLWCNVNRRNTLCLECKHVSFCRDCVDSGVLKLSRKELRELKKSRDIKIEETEGEGEGEGEGEEDTEEDISQKYCFVCWNVTNTIIPFSFE